LRPRPAPCRPCGSCWRAGTRPPRSSSLTVRLAGSALPCGCGQRLCVTLKQPDRRVCTPCLPSARHNRERFARSALPRSAMLDAVLRAERKPPDRRPRAGPRAARGAPAMVAVLNDPRAALATRACAAGALRHFLLADVQVRALLCVPFFVNLWEQLDHGAFPTTTCTTAAFDYMCEHALLRALIAAEKQTGCQTSDLAARAFLTCALSVSSPPHGQQRGMLIRWSCAFASLQGALHGRRTPRSLTLSPPHSGQRARRRRPQR